MNQVRETGGAIIGKYRISWPFVTLTVTEECLELNASITGKFIFRKDDITAIEPSSYGLSRGVKINHKVPTYNENIMFFTENATNLIEKIKQTGFLSNINPIPQDIDDRITKIQLQAGFPIKKQAAIGFVAIWNILFLYDFANFFVSHKTHFPLGIGAKSALGFILIICILLLMSESFRKFILKDGRSIDDIKKFIVFTIFGLGFLFLVLSLSAHIL